MRGSARRVDRAVASVAFGLTAAALLITAAAAHAEPPFAARRDPHAAARLVAFMARGERATYVADYDWFRTSRGKTLETTYTEANSPKIHATRSGSALKIDLERASYDCELLDDGPSCASQPRLKSLPASEVLRVAVAVGGYDVIQTKGRQVAGERAQCFEVKLESWATPLQDVGRRSDLCYAADGVLLRRRVARASSSDEYVALNVVRRLDARSVAPMISGFEKTAPPVGG